METRPVEEQVVPAQQEQPETAAPAAPAPPRNLSEWRQRKAKNSIIQTRLPSGLPVKMQKPDITQLFLGGAMPYELIAELEQFSPQGEGDDGQTAVAMSEVMKNYKKFSELLDVVFVEALLVPRVINDADWDAERRDAWLEAAPGDEVLLSEFSGVDGIGDKTYVLKWSSQGVSDLKQFRSGETD